MELRGKKLPLAEAAAIGLLSLLILTVISLLSARERARREVVVWLDREQDADSSFLETRPLFMSTGAPADRVEWKLSAHGHRFTRTREGLRVMLAPRAGTCDSNIVEVPIAEGKLSQDLVLPGVRFNRYDPNREEFRLHTMASQIPEPLMAAVVAIEDRRFYDHGGVDLRAMLRAMLANMRAGSPVQGGSTITQQLAKNVFLARERTLTRKLREVFLAVALEEALTKHQILEAYLNEIHFGRAQGRTIAGVGAAAEAYFGKPVECLDAGEAAVLAGIIRAPSKLSPVKHPERAKQRARMVLQAMKREADLDLSFVSNEPHRVAPWFSDYARTELPDARGLAVSTIDLTIQTAAEHALADGLAELDAKAKAPLEGAIVVIEVKTGRILAMVGGRDYRKSSFNRAARAKRQIGSMVKPFVALAALRTGRVDNNTVLIDEPMVLFTVDGRWSPRNVDYQFRGPVTLHTALTQSINLPFVQLSQDIGMGHVASLLYEVGLRETRWRYPSLALGAFEATPVQVAAAFAAIANGGTYIEPHAVERDVVSRRIASNTATHQVFDMMRSAVNRGTGYRLRSLGYRHDVAGKTGTTDETRDGWFVGIDGELAAVVWIGADSPQPTGLLAGDTAVPIWARLMHQVRKRNPPPAKGMPGTLKRVEVCNLSGDLATPFCPKTSHVVVRRETDVAHCEMFEHLEGIACADDIGNGDCSFVIDESHGEEARLQRDDN